MSKFVGHGPKRLTTNEHEGLTTGQAAATIRGNEWRWRRTMERDKRIKPETGSSGLGARYVHTNLVARDWRRLAAFYQDVLGCIPMPPERHLVESWVAEATRIAGAEIHGLHLRLPGWGDQGPTLEIFQYTPAMERLPAAMNRPGYGHLAFKVDDVDAAREAIIAAGGGVVGETVSVPIRGAGHITFVYATDPEGNVLELQHWA